MQLPPNTVNGESSQSLKEISSSVGTVVFDQETKMVYTSKSYSFQGQTLNACNQNFTYKEEGLYLYHYKLANDKKNPFDISQCDMLDFSKDTLEPFEEVSQEKLKEYSKVDLVEYNMNKRIYEIAKEIVSKREYTPIRQGDYNRVLNDKIYVKESYYGKKVFIDPNKDVEYLNLKKENDKQWLAWLNQPAPQETEVNDEVQEDTSDTNDDSSK